MVAYALAREARDRDRSLAILDVQLPGFGLEEATMDLSRPGWRF